MDKNLRQIMYRSYLVIFSLFVFSMVLVGKLIHLQFFQGEKYRELASKRTLKNDILQPSRGNIYADDGSIMATSVARYEVRWDAAVPSKIIYQSKKNELAKGLSKIINIDKNDLRVDTFRASGAGGQHVNKTDSAVRLTHLPSGIVVECQDGRSQHKNKEKALSLLAAKLKQQEIDNQQETIASERKILVGTGDRSEKIRTYNFPQGRMTDHRIKLTQHNLDQIMDGDIKSICDALLAENQLAMLSQLESE